MAIENYNAIVAIQAAQAIRVNADDSWRDLYEFTPAEGTLLNNFPAAMFTDQSIYWIERVRVLDDVSTGTDDNGDTYDKMPFVFHRGDSTVSSDLYLPALGDAFSWIVINESTSEYLMWPVSLDFPVFAAATARYQVIPTYNVDTGLQSGDTRAVAQQFADGEVASAVRTFRDNLISSELVVAIVPNNTFRPTFTSNADGDLAARAGTPTASFAPEGQAVSNKDGELSATAGSPTASFAPDRVIAGSQDAAFSASTGSPYARFVADVEYARIWPSITESPWVVAFYEMLGEVHELISLEDPVDVRRFVDLRTMPIGNLRQQLDAMNVPSTAFFGEVLTRAVGTNLYNYFAGRDQWAGVNQTAEDLLFEYVPTWKVNGAGRRVGIDFCITPSPVVVANPEYVEAVRDWLNWVLPHFEGNIAGRTPVEKAVTINLCDFAEVPFSLQMAATATITKLVTAR